MNRGRQTDEGTESREPQQLRPQLLRDVGCRQRPAAPREQLNVEARLVHRAKAAAGAGEERVDVRIGVQDRADAVHVVGHLVERRPPRGLNVDVQRVVVLIGNESFRHDAKHPDRRAEDGDEQREHRRAVIQNAAKTPFVELIIEIRGAIIVSA